MFDRHDCSKWSRININPAKYLFMEIYVFFLLITLKTPLKHVLNLKYLKKKLVKKI